VVEDLTLIEYTDEEVLDANDLAFGILDDTEALSWVQISKAGGPTEATTTIIQDALDDASEDGTVSEEVAWALVDQENRVAIGFNTAGHLLQEVASSFAIDIAGSDDLAESVGDSVIERITSVLPLVGWGDSITFGAGADEDGGAHGTDGWMAVLESDYGISIINRGVTGDTDDEIAARQGALVFQITVSGGSIPTSGGVTVVPELATFSPTRGGSVTGVIGLPDGTTITGTFSGPSDRSSVTFTRATAGSSISVGTVQLDARITHFDQYRPNMCTFWAGVNGLGAVDDTDWEDLVTDGSYDDWDDAVRHRYDPGADPEIGRIDDDYTVEAASIIANTARMVDWMDAINRRFLVFSLLDRGEGEGQGTVKGRYIRAINQSLELTYGTNFVDLHGYLVNRGLEDGGYTPTAQDILDVAADSVPDSLRTGGVHPNIVANGLIARQVAYHINRKGWNA
jgi:lysophospholipase L1-like esterase